MPYFNSPLQNVFNFLPDSFSAISGKQAGKKLERLPLSHTTWEAWSKKHPETLVLSTQTGYSRHYARNPYGNYHQSPSLYFPVNTLNKAYHPKEYVLGLEIQGKFKVYPFAELSQQKSPISDTFAGEKVKILFNPKYRTAKVINSHQEEIPSIIAFWFAWMAFYPHSEVFKARSEQKKIARIILCSISLSDKLPA